MRPICFLCLGKSKGGLTKGGLSPRFSEKIGGKSFLRNRAFSGQIGTFAGPIGAFSGPIGTNSSAPHSHGGRAEIAPKGPFLAQLAPFGPSPPLLSPPFDFPDLLVFVCFRFCLFIFCLFLLVAGISNRFPIPKNFSRTSATELPWTSTSTRTTHRRPSAAFQMPMLFFWFLFFGCFLSFQ